ncbi:MAG: 50S ribosomal protein L25 [Candidatus Niyogibacteria bacterium]|nr:50S ribosomal protein L25 [Candidatus Niyogibacteria bacterium]
MLLKVQERKIKGKKVKTLRQQGLIPAVLYGGNEKENTLFSVENNEFKKVWNEAGGSSVIELETPAGKKNVLIQDVAFNPLKGEPLHIDFYAVRMDKLITTAVPIVFKGESPAVKNLGGILVKVVHELEVEALPQNLPSEILIDISGLANLNDHFIVGDLDLEKSVKIKAEKDEVIVLVKAQEEEKEEEKELALEDIEVEAKGKKEKDEEAGATALSEKLPEKPLEKSKSEKK